jgi:hypothetical protein
MFVFAAFVGAANAQLCGTYTTTLEIKSEDDKAVENAVVQLIPLKENESRNKSFTRDETDRSKFSITFNEGHIIYEKYKIIVSADGFETAEKEIKFPHCKDQTFEIKLKKIKAENSTILTGTVAGEFGVIPQTKIYFQNKNGKFFTTSTNDSGEYTFEPDEGIYTIEFNAEGFKPRVIGDYTITLKSKMQLDVALEIGDITNTITVTSNCNFGIRDN